MCMFASPSNWLFLNIVCVYVDNGNSIRLRSASTVAPFGFCAHCSNQDWLYYTIHADNKLSTDVFNRL